VAPTQVSAATYTADRASVLVPRLRWRAMRIGIVHARRAGRPTRQRSCARRLARPSDTPVCAVVNEAQRDAWPRHAGAGEGGCGTVGDVGATDMCDSWTRVHGLLAGPDQGWPTTGQFFRNVGAVPRVMRW
jgi:hypothetical protein